MPAYSAKTTREKLAAQAKADSDAIAKIQNDPNLTEDGRRVLMAPIMERASKRYEAVLHDVETLVAEARAAYERAQPRDAQGRAAFAKPERAAALRSLAAGSSTPELQRLASLAATERDFAAAHGIRLGIADRAVTSSPNEAADLEAILATLDTIAPSDRERATADYVATKIEHARLVIGGPLNDMGLSEVTRDPSRVIHRMREAASIEQDGRVKYFGDVETTRLQILAGTVEAPSDAPAEVAA
jgi:hypothetical protein